MRNRDLAADYVRRADLRLQALDVLFAGESWADVVQEAQEIVELALKGLLRACGVDPPRIHDVSPVLLAEISRDLRRDRELAFYGSEDLTPSSFYARRDAERARDGARVTVGLIKPFVVG